MIQNQVMEKDIHFSICVVVSHLYDLAYNAKDNYHLYC